MANGSFGSNENRRKTVEAQRARRRGEGAAPTSVFSSLRRKAAEITPERWVDIVCCSIFLVFGIIFACTRSKLLDGLFYNVLLPVIYVGGRALAVLLVVGVIALIVSFNFRRRRYW